MRFYEALIQARLPKNAAAMHSSTLIELERMRNYQGRINQLDTDRARLEDVIRNMEGNIDHLAMEYKGQVWKEKIMLATRTKFKYSISWPPWINSWQTSSLG